MKALFFQVKKEQEVQLKYRFLKSRLIALEINTEAFLKICTPDQRIWEKIGWRGKNIRELVTQIVENCPQSIGIKANLCILLDYLMMVNLLTN